MLYMLVACTLSSGWTVKMSMELNYAVNSESHGIFWQNSSLGVLC